MIFDYYLAGASLRKVVNMLYAKQIPSPTGKVKWTRAAVDHLLSSSKYIAIVGFDSFANAQYEKANRRAVRFSQRLARERGDRLPAGKKSGNLTLHADCRKTPFRYYAGSMLQKCRLTLVKTTKTEHK